MINQLLVLGAILKRTGALRTILEVIFDSCLFMFNPEEQTYFTLRTDQYLCNLSVDDSAFPPPKKKKNPTN